MCGGCAIAAISAANGVRAWLQGHVGWLTPRRLRAVTAALMAVGALGGSVAFSSSSQPAPAHRDGSPAASATR